MNKVIIRGCVASVVVALAAARTCGADVRHWAVEPMSDVMRLPDKVPTDGVETGVVRIVMAKDEYEPGSFVVQAAKNLGKVRFELAEFKQVKGKGEGEEWAFDYSTFDQYVAFAKSCGLGPDIACYTMCPWHRELKLDDGEWGQFLVDFRKHLVAKGWFDNTYIAMDERDPEEVKRLADFIRARAPGMKIAMAGKKVPTAFSHIGIENYSQYIKYSDGSHIAEAKRRHAEGKITTFYVCTGPVHPNNQLRSPLVENFWIGAYPAFSGMDGFLRWSWNSWPRDPLTDASFGDWAAGETFLVYPDGSPSMRFLELRNGIVAAEKVRILREAGALDQPKFDELVRRYDFVYAQSNRVDFVKLKAATLELVNGSVKKCK